MFKQIYWRGHFKVASREKVAKLRGRFESTTGTPTTLTDCKRSPQSPDCFEARFTSPLGEETVERDLFQTLILVQKVLPHWNVSGPWKYETGGWEFSGHTKQEAQEILWLPFEIR